ncbi:MAG: HEAT repeat domain-containing protein [Desulfobacterales bacterium]|nr:HEAT repeat domain-containing protein [Desulfobacterales bacterium]MCP4160087.1 HEAT repeat domain-containing protein [Deltaproteobacteria bacterium]
MATQLISTIHHYIFFTGFKQSVESIKNAGYYIIPNITTLENFISFKNMFCGGFFITITLGSTISLFIVFAIILLDKFNVKRSYIPFLIIQIIVLLFTNIKGLNISSSLYLIVLPPVIYILTSQMKPKEQISKKKLKIKILPVVILLFLFLSMYNRALFHNVRDSILLTNKVGISVNSFYYKYTLFPAETIKPVSKKTLKTYSIDTINNRIQKIIQNVLVKRDYLLVKNHENDMEIKVRKDMLYFSHNGNLILKESINDFVKSPSKTLDDFSHITDKNYYFRSIILFSLVIGFPITLYFLISSLINLLFSLILRKHKPVGDILCFITGLLFFLSVYNMDLDIDKKNLTQNLSSPEWEKKVAALKYIAKYNIEITNFKNLDEITKNSTQVKYWFAIVLGKSRSKDTDKYLLKLIDDNEVIIQCKALEAIGLLRKNRFLKVIKDKMKSSKVWYVQLNGYKALRRTGWSQKILN